MSGGVDSSVAAALLVNQGYDVIGMMLRLWSEPGSDNFNRCCAPDALELAGRVSSKLKIPFYAVAAQQIFYEKVVKHFLNGYAQGLTPNPCLICNRHIRWQFLLSHAISIGADFLATGHYARLRKSKNGRVQLLRSIDKNKDQSYVLHALKQEQLTQTLLPLGNLTKKEVRQLAEDFDLPVANRPDSQDLCFLDNKDYRDFLLRHLPEVQNPGHIVDRLGKVLGQHQGLAFYTIGQRKGLGLSFPHPLYVLEKDALKNVLIVGSDDDLGKSELIANNVNWIAGKPPEKPFKSQVKIRYKATLTQAIVSPLGDQGAQVMFEEPLRAITPGQAAVFYSGDVCLGGGIIQPAGTYIQPNRIETLQEPR
jgi:tRNA-uridine 2-sulfurtransferase